MGSAALVALFGIFAVLILEFRSFKASLIVASVIPLGILGGILGLWVSGYTLSFTAMIGMIALVGIEIKNSILLVDFTNQLRAQGTPLREAIETAGEVRFLPILLTSVTAIGGMLPLALQGSGLYSPLACVIIGGLITSTLLSRLVTPACYLLLAPRDEAVAAGSLPVGASAAARIIRSNDYGNCCRPDVSPRRPEGRRCWPRRARLSKNRVPTPSPCARPRAGPVSATARRRIISATRRGCSRSLPRRSCASGSSRSKPPDSPPARSHWTSSRPAALAHIDFLISHPRLEGLCWRDNLVNRADPALQEVLQRMTAGLIETMSAATGKTLVPDKEANPSTLLAVSVVHGFATLVNERMILQHAADSDRRAQALSMADEMLELLSTAFGAAAKP